MGITLRARPTCHYCGKRNSPSNNQRKFTCQHCQADNYLDESGQITDVPTVVAATPRQYAVPLTPAFENAEGSIFCSTCLKNQYMYNTALSEYLPDPDHPEYERFEAAIPAFKQDLERRFPTCCANCEPKVKAQLQRATYNARSDHVRRVLDRSKQRRNASRWGWRSLLVNAAGLGWLVSLIVQLMWHALGSQAHGRTTSPYIRPSECLKTWPVPIQCPAIVERFVGPSLLLGVLCIWWNPKWQHRLEGREGRLVGLDKFYKVQGGLLALRFVVWTIIKDVPNLADLRSMIHTVSLVMITMVTCWSQFSIIKIYMPRIVDWSQDPAPLLDSRQYIPPVPNQQVSPPNSQQAVPVSIFNTSTGSSAQPWRPPTPPIDEDAMEWDPTPAAFSPNPKKVSYKSSEPTPFRGTLPAFPRGSLYSTKNEVVVEQPKAIGLPIGFFDKSHGKPLQEKTKQLSRDTGLAQPKFFPDMARADTGLEGIFDKVFSLHDEAQISQSGDRKSRPVTHRTPGTVGSSHEQSLQSSLTATVSKIFKLFTVGILAFLGISFTATCYFELPSLQITSTANMLCILAAIPILNLVLQITFSQMSVTGKLDASTIVLLMLESFALSGLYYTQPEEGSLLISFWNNLIIGSIASLLIQELYTNFSEGRAVADTTRQNYYVSKQKGVPSLPKEIDMPPQPPQPILPSPQTLRRSSSDESLASTTSFMTTSTASGWKTPTRNHREELSTNSSTSYGFGGLSLKNDRDFGTGNSVAGPRTRRSNARGSQRAW